MATAGPRRALQIGLRGGSACTLSSTPVASQNAAASTRTCTTASCIPRPPGALRSALTKNKNCASVRLHDSPAEKPSRSRRPRRRPAPRARRRRGGSDSDQRRLLGLPVLHALVDRREKK
eukprot:1260653-Pyramimonas_sp.AAC.1